MTALSSKRVIVTGAAGDIGATVAHRFAAAGASVALFDRKKEMLAGVAARCRSLGVRVCEIAVDQTDPAAVDTGVSQAISELGGVDVLFANAGYGKFAPFLDQNAAHWTRHVDVNLNGTFHVCQQVARAMVNQGTGGSIVINASSGAIQYTNLLSAYCVTKAALAMLVRAMASELGPHDIRVNGVLPGVIETGMTAPMLGSQESQRDYLVRETPAGRLGRPEDIAGAVIYLSSDDAGFVTGHSLPVDGGQTLLGQPQWYVTDFANKGVSEWAPAR